MCSNHTIVPSFAKDIVCCGDHHCYGVKRKRNSISDAIILVCFSKKGPRVLEQEIKGLEKKEEKKNSLLLQQVRVSSECVSLLCVFKVLFPGRKD